MKMKKSYKQYVPLEHKRLYRNYYIHQFRYIYDMIDYNHKKFVHLNDHMYISNEMIRSNRNEYLSILNQQKVWYVLQHNIMNHLIMNTWKLIDDLDKSYFPTIDFNYDNEFRNVYMLFEIIQQIIRNKIE